MKTLEKARPRHYDTANGLAQDITRYLTNEPAVFGRQVTKWQRRADSIAFVATKNLRTFPSSFTPQRARCP